jgi:hypothetical protein
LRSSLNVSFKDVANKLHDPVCPVQSEILLIGFLGSKDLPIPVLDFSVDESLPIWQGNLCLALSRPEAAVMAFRKAQALKADLRSYQGRHTPCLES